MANENPMDGAPPPSEDEAPREEKAKALTRAELAILLAAIPSESRLFCTFLAHTGLRISEAVGLRWEHLFGQMRRDGRTTSEIKKTRAALSVMFATALEDGVVTSNPPSLPSSRRRRVLPCAPKTSTGAPSPLPPSGRGSRSR